MLPSCSKTRNGARTLTQNCRPYSLSWRLVWGVSCGNRTHLSEDPLEMARKTALEVEYQSLEKVPYIQMCCTLSSFHAYFSWLSIGILTPSDEFQYWAETAMSGAKSSIKERAQHFNVSHILHLKPCTHYYGLLFHLWLCIYRSSSNPSQGSSLLWSLRACWKFWNWWRSHKTRWMMFGNRQNVNLHSHKQE